MIALQARGLKKTYRGLLARASRDALAGVDLTVPAGSAFGLIGPNGAGKTTLIKILLGVVAPSGGEVEVLGGAPSDVRVRARIGYLPERLHLPASLRPPAFLASVARLKGLGRASSEIDQLLRRVGLAQDTHRRIGGFSKGMRQRLGLAAALLGRPELLVLDEPTDGIDPLGRVDIRNLLTDELARGATLLLNSHLLSETERVCTRIGILSAGRLVREGTLEELRRSEPRWKCRFAGELDVHALREAGFSPAPEAGLWWSRAEDPVALDAELACARASGALLVELVPEERDLEHVLADALGAVVGQRGAA